MFNSIWYSELVKPAFTPPAQIFVSAWTILYILMFISFLTYIFKPSVLNKKLGYMYFFIQLFLNLIWSPVFFYFKNIGLALLILILLDLFVILTIKHFYNILSISGMLLIPYFLWIIFATYLNIGFLILN